MSLRLQTEAWLLDLHCSVALTEWDLDQELKLQTTTDQIHQDDRASDQLFVQRPSIRASRRKDDFIWYDKTSDTFVKPNLWLMVNPNIACPIHYQPQALPPAALAPPPTHQATFPETNSHDALLQEETIYSSMTNQSTVRTKVFSCKTVKNRRKPRTNSKPQESWSVKPGSWPRPPVNYCLLIGLALKHSGGLKVQQIYNFTRELFPFFQTAPDGWKNTIRHNLCFNSSFRKTYNHLCGFDGKRKSCLWHLTPDGQRRLQDELLTLTNDTLLQLERSAANPDRIQTLLSL